jgi:hypothetical protein
VLLLFFSHWHSINLTIERIRHSFSCSLSFSMSFFIDIHRCKFNIHICMASTSSINFFFFFFLAFFLFLSIRDAYKWSAKLPRELLLLVHVFRRMGKKDSLAYSFVRSLSVLACTHGYHNHNLLVYRCIIAPMCLLVDGCWDFLSLSLSLFLLLGLIHSLYIYVCIVFTWGKRENKREKSMHTQSLTAIIESAWSCKIKTILEIVIAVKREKIFDNQ